MRKIFVVIFIFLFCGCSVFPVQKEMQNIDIVCSGTTDLPEHLTDKFVPVEDARLLKEAIGGPSEGKLCQGKVYKSKAGTQITLFRAWNSTNPNSKFGKWWAFQEPAGKMSAYRLDYEICYQWSPLDKLVKCTLKSDTKVVVGTGQSAECSEYLTYPISDKQQIYINNASESVSDCTFYEGEFSWK